MKYLSHPLVDARVNEAWENIDGTANYVISAGDDLWGVRSTEIFSPIRDQIREGS